MGLGMRMAMSGPTPMRYAADKPHNPSSFQGHCRWPSKHTHSRPHSGGMGRWRFHWGTAEHGFFGRLYLLRCEYFIGVRMNGGGCDRCLARTMQGARTPFQESNNRIFRAAAPLTHPHGPLPSPCSVTPPATCPLYVSCCTRSTCPLLLMPLDVVLRVLRVLSVLRVPPMMPLLLPLEPLLVCCVFCRVSFVNNLIL